jgi:hypothetical protein
MRKITLFLFAVVLVLAVTHIGNAQTSAVKMNEIQSRGVAGDLDWIELYNSSSAPVNISGCRIYDIGGQGGTKPKKPFSAGTIIPAKGFYVVITDTASFAGDLSGFGLSNSGEKVWLEDTTTGTIIDTVTFGATANATQTYGRGPDGGQWTVLNTITRGKSNGSIVMNEIYSRGVAGNLDWIEIYNSVSASVNISGYRIYDIGGQGKTKPKKPFPVGTIIPSKGFYVIITDTASFTGDLSGFGLSSTGETAWLEDTTTATLADSITFAAMDVTQSYGRYPDGGDWKLLNTITRGTSNSAATAVETRLEVPMSFALEQNYPNPFNPSTCITFALPRQEQVQLTVYNAVGQRIRTLINSQRPAGSHTVVWDGKDNQGREVASGVYFYELMTGTFSKSAKMLLVR